MRMTKYTTLKDISSGQEFIASTIMLAHKTPQNMNKVLVLVEGLDDISVYEKFFNKNSVDFQDCHGCEVVETVHQIIKSKTHWKYISIRDCDFLVLSSRKRNTEDNFFYTDCHDAEMMMIKCSKLIKSTMLKLCGDDNYDIKARICHELFYLSMLKWFISFRSLQFKFLGLDLAHLSWNSQITNVEAVRFIVPTSKSHKEFPMNAYQRFLTQHPNPDVNHLINGHDFITRWAAIIKNDFHKQYSDRDFRRIVCGLYTINMVKCTSLYKSISEWERNNGLSVLNT